MLNYSLWILMNTFRFRWLSLARKRSCGLGIVGRVETQIPHLDCSDAQEGDLLIPAEEGRVFQLLTCCPLTLRKGGLLSLLVKVLTPTRRLLLFIFIYLE